MSTVTIHYEGEHTEESRAALDEAVAGFVDALKTRGYLGYAQIEWERSPLRTSANVRDTARPNQLRERVSEAEGPANTPPVEARPQPSPSVTGTRFEFKHKGGGYYELTVDGEVVGTVKGKAAADAWLDEKLG